MWESRLLLARFPRGLWEVWEAWFWLSTLSTAPPFPQLSSSLAEASGAGSYLVVGYCGPGSFFFLLFFSR